MVSGVPLSRPEQAQCLEGGQRQRNEAVFAALAVADMDPHGFRVDVADAKVEGFAKTQAHAVGGEQEHLIFENPQAVDEHLDFSDGEDVREGLDLGRPDDGNPVPIFFQDIFPEELESGEVTFDRAPGVGFGQPVEILLHLIFGQSIWTAAKRLGDAPDSATVGINCGGAHSVVFEHDQLFSVQLCELFLIFGIHEVAPEIKMSRGWKSPVQELYSM